jgi:hypothetical protein
MTSVTGHRSGAGGIDTDGNTGADTGSTITHAQVQVQTQTLELV